jgi:membrane peptidoglycan carboxypeptidase
LSDTPAIALGVDDVSMRELVRAYSIFPNLGAASEPYLIDRVETLSGGNLFQHEAEKRDAIDPAVAYVMHSMMRGVVMRGTAARLNQYGLGYVAGKTGTTNNYRDAWFIGYVPDLLTAVWVGFDDGKALRISSGEAAVPMWAEYMRATEHSKSELQAPDGVSIVEVEAATGQVWRTGCGPSVVEVFLSGTEPTAPCGGVWDGNQVLGPFEEPAFISEEQWAEWARQMAGMQEVQPVLDPDSIETSLDDSLTAEDLDTAIVEPPVVNPPVIVPPPIETRPPPPRDTSVIAPVPPVPIDSLLPIR